MCSFYFALLIRYVSRIPCMKRPKEPFLLLTQKRRIHGSQKRPEASDLIPSPSLKNPIPHQNSTRENQAPTHGKIKCTLNQRSNQNPVSIKPTTRPSYPPPAAQDNPTNSTILSTPTSKQQPDHPFRPSPPPIQSSDKTLPAKLQHQTATKP